jgi:hypothetical protein
MFLVLRSVFWLTLAYVVIKPGMPLPDATEMGARAAAIGSQALSAQVDSIACGDLTCAGGKAMLAAAIKTAPLVSAPVAGDRAADAVPTPRPRPHRLG